jgi:hypothetical protein
MANILKHNIERFGMVTVMDVVLFDINTKLPKIYLDTLKMTNINTEGSNKEIRGGIGNDMLISYDFGRTANIEIQDALISPDSLALLWGTTVNETAVTKQVTENKVGAETTGIVTLSSTPVEDTLKVMNALTGTLIPGTVSGTTFTPTTAENSDEISVVVTYATLVAGAKEIVLTNDNFPEAMRMVGESFVIDETTGGKKRIQIDIPKFKINSNFSFSMDAEGDASVFDFSGVALANDGEIIRIKYLGNY